MYLAAGDVNGDGYADLIAGMGDGGPPEVKIFSGMDLTWHRQSVLADFYASNAAETEGAKVGITKIDSDGKADLLVGTQGGRMSVINGATISSSANPALSMSFAAFSGLNAGLYVG
jgi:serralysin